MQTAFQPSFDDLSTPLIDVTFCVLDLETTGGSPANCEITEIGAVKYRGGEALGTFQTLVDPGLAIPPSITILTGITEAMVVDAPNIATALPTFLEFIGDSVIVGHNVRFDMSFLNAAAIRYGYGRIENKTVDTAALARRLVRPEVRNLRLQTLAAHFASPTKPNHRAFEDAKATAHVLHALLERVGSLGVTNLDDLLQLPTARGSAHYSKISLTQDLPRKPGVYVFRDKNGNPLYVGKASNLRARVRQYFYGDKRRKIADLMRELHTIDHQVCETVIEAEVTELRLIHTYKPRYNRRSRPPKASHFVKLTRERFPRLSVVRAIRDDGIAYLGPFRSKQTADLVVAAIWDASPIRRCRSRPASRTGKCASAQLGVARCPCDGTLGEVEYQGVVGELIAGLTESPDLLLTPLEERMTQLSFEQRFEEAAWLRDRHDALAGAIDRRQRWQSLATAGLVELEDESGRCVVVDHGRFAEARNPGETTALRLHQAPNVEVFEVPESVQAAEEAEVIWRWLAGTPLRLTEATGEFSFPLKRAVRLGRPTSKAA
ncbi:MAG: DEDD exonuclease domain-containing protein [Actinomycetota bacterium]|nr:DEDD exonuclease domain-containing protein [Actinomycetota bacterium]